MRHPAWALPLAWSCHVAMAQEASSATQGWALHAQSTIIEQFHPGFASPYRGPNSLDPGRRGAETATLALFGGIRLWRGAEAWINPEIDQGFGLSNSTGLAGFPSGGAYKLGQATPYILLQRLFLRQTIDLGGPQTPAEADADHLAGHARSNRLVLTAGKLAVTDIFDANRYAHDPTGDFLNWSVIDSAAFDYVANAYGYTYGAAAEWYENRWVLRAGIFDGSETPNSRALSTPLDRQFQFVGEAEARTRLLGQEGAIRLLFFATHARLARLAALDRLLAADPAATRDQLAALRAPATKIGAAINLEQAVSDHAGLFLRASLADGRTETYAYTDVDRSLAAGASGDGAAWHRPDDHWGAAFVVNLIDRDRRNFLAEGGLGLLVGDGRLPVAGPEQILETWYSLPLPLGLQLTADYQLANHPAYNTARGPVHILGARLHVAF